MATFGNIEAQLEEPVVTEAPKLPTSQRKLKPGLTISNLAAEVFSVRFSPDGRYLAAGCGDGAIRVFNASTGTESANLTSNSSNGLPTTVIRFRPHGGDRTKNVLLAANANGGVEHWHVSSGKLLHAFPVKDDSNQVYALDYDQNGDRFATGGKDCAVRIYDEDSKKLLVTLKGGQGYGSHVAAGHSNRIFALKWHPTEPNCLVSGGWDNTIQIWDARKDGGAVRSFYGPHLCGDSLDISPDGSKVLTGSWRPEDQVQLWDFNTGKLLETVPWASSLIHHRDPCMVYAAQFSKHMPLVAAGGSGANEARVFDCERGNALVGVVAGLDRGVFTVDFAPGGKRLAVAGGDAAIRVLDVVDAAAWEKERPGTAAPVSSEAPPPAVAAPPVVPPAVPAQ